ncbi:MAG: arginase [Crocinitomicaceae bacterium]|nr:arginase [Crocinitomicaceae bacterium]
MSLEIQFIFNPSEIGAGTRGASLGPAAIVSAARDQNSSFFSVFPPIILADCNYLLDVDSPYRKAKRIDGMVKVFGFIEQEIQNQHALNKLPFIISGDHGSAGGTLSGLKKAYPGKKIGVLWIDAHADMHTPYTTPSGNLHGMPLATALGVDNLACKKNEVDVATATQWNSLKSTAILPEDLVFIGVRDTESQEDFLMKELGIKNYSVAELRSMGMIKLIDELKAKFSSCDIVYVSFDVDSIDPSETSLGTGTPVPNGLTIEEANCILTEMIQLPNIAAFELVEVNPCLDDKKNKMAEVAFELIQNMVKVLEKAKNGK